MEENPARPESSVPCNIVGARAKFPAGAEIFLPSQGIKCAGSRYAFPTGTRLHDRNRKFESIALPHLGSAYNLARWLLRDDQAADDAVQEAYLRALRYFASYRGADADSARPWLLGIVRNACYAWLRDNRGAGTNVEFDDEIDGGERIDGNEAGIGRPAPPAVAEAGPHSHRTTRSKRCRRRFAKW
jgi:RNA polymerase sigma factor (sigma-70 family)